MLHAREEEEEALLGCRVHYYGESTSIFSDIHHPHQSARFETQARRMPWEEKHAGWHASNVHAYCAPRPPGLYRTPGPQPVSWHTVRDQQVRMRPPREKQKRAVPGSTLEKKRVDLMDAVAQRTRVAGDEPPRATILRGGGREGGRNLYHAPAPSAPSLLPPQRLPNVTRPSVPRASRTQLSSLPEL